MFVLLAERDRSAILLTTGGRFAQMDEIISAAGFAGRTHYMGVLPFKQLQEVMACGDIMLMPFRNSSLNRARYPNRFGDYLAAGRPVVSNPTGDLGQVMQTEKIGILVEETPQAFAEGIQALLDAPHLLEEMGQNARHLAETRFSGPAIGKTLFNLYQTLVTS
jgi:glycosyltransferase involved in cell wall biosynthesis